MYAVIRIGTSQERVSEGQVVRVDLRPEEIGKAVEFSPVLIVDGDKVLAGPALTGAKVTAKILGEEKGPKIRGLTYKSKANQRKRWGHRQHYSTVEITKIATKGPAKAPAAEKADAPVKAAAPAKKAAAPAKKVAAPAKKAVAAKKTTATKARAATKA
jgi:large subunit ribosomal protein L21